MCIESKRSSDEHEWSHPLLDLRVAACGVEGVESTSHPISVRTCMCVDVGHRKGGKEKERKKECLREMYRDRQTATKTERGEERRE